MRKAGLKIIIPVLAVNLALFTLKIYVGISTSCLSVYCDSINNLGDALSCAIAALGFGFAHRLTETQNARVQSLVSFVTGIVIALTGVFFAWRGLEKLMYPTFVSYYTRYAVLIAVTAAVKLIMGLCFLFAQRRNPSPVFRTMMLDSFMDTGVTCCALMGFRLVRTINFAVDGLAAVIIGAAVAVNAVKITVEQTKNLIGE